MSFNYRLPNALGSSCHCAVSLVAVAADRLAAEPKTCSNAGTKFPEDRPARYSSGNTSATPGDFRTPRRQDRRGQPPSFAGDLVDDLAVGVDVGGDLGPQRRGQHLSGAGTDQIVQQRATHHRRGVLVWLGLFLDYLERGRTFPNQRANAGP